MGAAESSSPADDAAPASGLEGISGWKILHVAEGSPCDQLGLVPYFDLITHCNQTPLSSAENSLVSHLHPHVPITLTVFSLSTRKSRPVVVTPFRGWGGEGLLGLMIRYEALETVEMECIHVLEIYPSSPAYNAGLQAYSDYLLGSSKLAFKGWDQLDYWLSTQDTVNSGIMVFNTSTWRVREVWITPNSRWGGKGSLGADVAQGYVHRLPVFDSTRPVRMDKRSRVRRGKKAERGLRYEEDQLMLNLLIGADADDDVNLLSIRVREKEEYQHKAPVQAAQTPATAKQQPIHQPPHQHHAHAHDDHGHSHGGADHGHSHSHRPSIAHNPAAPQPSSTQLQPKTQETTPAGQEQHGHAHSHGDGGHQHGPTVTPVFKPVVNTTNATVQTTQTSSTTGKKPLTAQLPRLSRESSPTFTAVNTPAISNNNAPPTSTSSISSSNTTMQPSPSPSPSPSSLPGPPFPSLAPTTTTQQPISQSSSNRNRNGHSHSEHGHSHSNGHSHSHGHSNSHGPA